MQYSVSSFTTDKENCPKIGGCGRVEHPARTPQFWVFLAKLTLSEYSVGSEQLWGYFYLEDISIFIAPQKPKSTVLVRVIIKLIQAPGVIEFQDHIIRLIALGC